MRGMDRKCFNRFCLRSRFSRLVFLFPFFLSKSLSLAYQPFNNGHFVIVGIGTVYINKLSAILFLYFLDVLVLLPLLLHVVSCSGVVVDSILFNFDRCSFLLYHYIFKLLLKVKRLQQSGRPHTLNFYINEAKGELKAESGEENRNKV